MLISPGHVLKTAYLVPNKISAYRLAKATGMDAARVSGILKGKRRITADTAIRLGRALSTGPEVWLNLQARYDREQAELKAEAQGYNQIQALVG